MTATLKATWFSPLFRWNNRGLWPLPGQEAQWPKRIHFGLTFCTSQVLVHVQQLASFSSMGSYIWFVCVSRQCLANNQPIIYFYNVLGGSIKFQFWHFLLLKFNLYIIRNAGMNGCGSHTQHIPWKASNLYNVHIIICDILLFASQIYISKKINILFIPPPCLAPTTTNPPSPSSSLQLHSQPHPTPLAHRLHSILSPLLRIHLSIVCIHHSPHKLKGYFTFLSCFWDSCTTVLSYRVTLSLGAPYVSPPLTSKLWDNIIIKLDTISS